MSIGFRVEALIALSLGFCFFALSIGFRVEALIALAVGLCLFALLIGLGVFVLKKVFKFLIGGRVATITHISPRFK